jgi:hypothetical protein
LVSPKGQHLAGVPVRRVRLVEGVVAVIPEDEQCGINDRGESRRASAEDDPHATGRSPEEVGVAPLWTQLSRQRDEGIRPDSFTQGRIESGDIPSIGRNDDHAAVRLGGGHEVGQSAEPFA